MEISYRHLGGGREEHLAVLEAIHVILKFRELRGADHAIAPDEERRAHLQVTVLARVQVEHELNEGALEPRTLAGEADEAAAAQLRGAFRIEQFQRGADGDVIADFSLEARLLAPGAHDRIVARFAANRRGGVREIRDLEEEILLLLFADQRLLVQRSHLIAGLADAIFQLGGGFAAAALAADLFAESFAFGL